MIQRRKEVAAFVGKSGNKDDKLIVTYNDILAQLNLLKTEKDPSKRETISRRIIELDFALKTTGPPRSLSVFGHRVSSLLQTWSIPRKSPPSKEASQLYDPKIGSLVSVDAYPNYDLSALDPSPDSPFWRRPKNISEADVEENFYEGGSPSSRNRHRCHFQGPSF